jgi:phosphonate transport system ATP-binding protein
LVCIHHLDLAMEFADRIVGIGQGIVVFEGPPVALDADAMSRIYRINKPLAWNALPRRGISENVPAKVLEF